MAYFQKFALRDAVDIGYAATVSEAMSLL